MDPIRLKTTAAALGAVVLATTALAVAGRVNGPTTPAVATADAAAGAVLVERVAAALDAPTPPAPIRVAAAPAVSPADIEDTAAAIASATRMALAAIAEAPAAAPAASDAAETPGFRRLGDAAAPAFVISAADARAAADQGWVAASGVAPATLELRPRPRSD